MSTGSGIAPSCSLYRSLLTQGPVTSESASNLPPEIGGEHIRCGRDQHSHHHTEEPCHVEPRKRGCEHNKDHEQGQGTMAFVERPPTFGRKGCRRARTV
jgi:hypothetical protein